MADLSSDQIQKITELIKIQTKELSAKVDQVDGLIALGQKHNGDIVEGLADLLAAKQGPL
jgi:hypothetical protein